MNKLLRPLKVLHIYRTYFPDTQGGLEETIRQICITTSAHNIESRVLALSKNPDPPVVDVDGVQIYRVKQNAEIASCGISLEAFKLYRKLQEWADIINFHFPWPFADILQLTGKSDKPRIITYHSDIVRQRALLFFYRPIMEKFLQSADRIVCTSPNYFVTSDVLTKYQDKIEIIPIGIKESTYPKGGAEFDALVRERWGTDYFLFVGVFRYYKGLHLLLEAAKGAPFKVVIAGSGPIEKELKQQARDLGLTNVNFTGRVSNEIKSSLFRNCRAVVFPSYLRTEAFGVTLLEGAMFGKPLISTEIGSGTSHVCIQDVNGFVVPPGFAKFLRQAMDQLYEKPDLARKMGAQSRRRYEQLFTGEIMGVRYAELYKELTLPAPVPSMKSIL